MDSGVEQRTYTHFILHPSKSSTHATPHTTRPDTTTPIQEYALSRLPLGRGLAGMEAHTGLSLCARICEEFGHLLGFYGAFHTDI